MSTNLAVATAYRTGQYTDARGVRWVKGMDGWFDRSSPDMICLAYHHTFVEMIENENPE